MSGPECVKVAIRIRPMSQAEQARGCQIVIEQAAPDHPQIHVCGGRTPSDIFSYSYVFPPTVAQSQLYEQSVAPLLTKLLAGYNATILAYGQTSSGKTFTMGTDFSGEMNFNVGVIPRAIIDIFRMINDDSVGAPCVNMKTQITCSFIEVYQDNVYDLLEDKSGNERQPIDIREAVGGDIVLQGLTEIEAPNEQTAFNCLVRGSTGRVVRATAMNNVSSRSHAIFTLTIQQTARDNPSITTRSKFHLVDLAGSERSKKTSTTGDRFKEGVEINKCLLALGNVITVLATNGGSGKTHIPYRNSKLTRLLQDSLGGNSYTVMIACVSPADYNLSETYSTLRYAYRVCNIKNKPIVNQDPQQARIKELEATVQDLRLRILSLKSDSNGNGGDEEEQNGKYPVGKPDRATLIRGLSDTDIRSPRKVEQEQSPATSTTVSMLQANNRLLEKQLQLTLHEIESHEMRAMTADKLLEDIEQVLAKYGNSANQSEKRPETVAEGEMRQELTVLLSKYKEELFAQGIANMSHPNELNRTYSNESEELERKSTYHTQEQMRIHQELSQLKRDLTLKEELHRKCMDNNSVVQTITSKRERELNEQLREYEGQIRGMEEQLAELNVLLENTKASEKRSKLAEERRRKVQQLESELTVLRQKSRHQEKMLKLNEKDAQRIAGLSSEIQQMKMTRVKLLKALRTESENFRQWRLNREKEIIQLKAKDRKREVQLKKLESTYTLQKHIMQRKMDETIQVNKRLKATLERRQRSPVRADRSAMRGAEAARWIKHELELICNTVEASVTLKMLRTQRAQQSKKRNQLRAQLTELSIGGVETPGADGSMDERQQQRAELEEEMRQCETDLEYRNAQISDLQQKIHSMDTESQLATLGEGLASLPEARDAFQRLLEQLVHTHTRLFETRFELVELQATSECQEEALGQSRAQLQQAEQQYKEKVVQLERTYEEKLSFLLMQRAAEGGSAPDGDGGEAAPHTDTVLQEAIQRIEQLREELESHKKMVQVLHNDQAKMVTRRHVRLPTRLVDHEMDAEIDEDEEMELFDDSEVKEQLERELDPDFRGTPLNKRKKSISIRELSLPNKILNTTIHCSCAGNCGTKRCGCQKHGIQCHPACKCPPSCVNRTLYTISEPGNMSMDVTEGGADTSGSAAKQNDKENTFIIPSDPARVTKDEREELDILEYVAKYRKRKPLLDI
ncbi:chromosome-associated kinesin KIF4A [Anopheles moucheti]|uniref:chromosome-associated kinesin KIF4A n=1 Tax=Anopheles moucheti TaxID=186751 RepID=UPI0022F1428E|nr:chromosome-associated kinesin KIF4A [Anopheles moucheti]